MSKQPLATSVTGGLKPMPAYKPISTKIVRNGDDTMNTAGSPVKPHKAPAWDSDTTGASLPRLKVPC